MRKPHSRFLASIYEQMLMLRYAMATVEAYLDQGIYPFFPDEASGRAG